MKACPPKPALADRPLIAAARADSLESLFKVLANGTRLRLLHALVRSGELCVNDLAATVGMTPQAVSNQLQRLVDRAILGHRRVGNNVYYRVIDACVIAMLEQALCLTECAETRRLSASLAASGRASPEDAPNGSGGRRTSRC